MDWWRFFWRISLSRVFVGISWRNYACYARKPQKFDTTVATSLKFVNNQWMSYRIMHIYVKLRKILCCVHIYSYLLEVKAKRRKRYNKVWFVARLWNELMLSMEGFIMHFTTLVSRSTRFKTIVMLIHHIGRQPRKLPACGTYSNKNNVCGTGRAV
jgi:hypothetical protein